MQVEVGAGYCGLGIRHCELADKCLNKAMKTLKNAVFWNVTPCGSCSNRRFEGTYRHHHHGCQNQLVRNVSNSQQPKHTAKKYNATVCFSCSALILVSPCLAGVASGNRRRCRPRRKVTQRTTRDQRCFPFSFSFSITVAGAVLCNRLISTSARSFQLHTVAWRYSLQRLQSGDQDVAT
jgi:hypothetical protein